MRELVIRRLALPTLFATALLSLGGCIGRNEDAASNIRSCSPSMTDVRGGGMLVSESPLYHWADSQ